MKNPVSKTAAAIVAAIPAFSAAADEPHTVNVDLTQMLSGHENVIEYLQYGHRDDFNPANVSFTKLDDDLPLPTIMCVDRNNNGQIDPEESSSQFNITYDRALVGAVIDENTGVQAMRTSLQPEVTGDTVPGHEYAQKLLDAPKMDTQWMLVTNKHGEYEAFYAVINGDTYAMSLGPDTPVNGEMNSEKPGVCVSPSALDGVEPPRLNDALGHTEGWFNHMKEDDGPDAPAPKEERRGIWGLLR